MAPKRKAPAASSSTATKKTTTRSSTKKQAPPPSSDSESDDSPPPVKKKKTTTTAATKAKPKPKAKAPVKSTSTKGKKKQEEIILSDTSDEQDELDSQSESEDEPVKPKKAAKGKGKATATTKKVEPEKKSKSKSKPKVEYTSEPDSEDDDVVIQEPVPKSKKKATVSKKASTSTKSKSKLKANSPPSTPSENTPIPSTSSKLSKSSKSKKRALSPPPKPVPFEVALKKWFEPFAEKGEEGEGERPTELMMGGDGIEKLFEEMELSMEGVYPFLLAWDLKAQPGTFGSFSYKDFENTLRPLNIRTSSELSSHLTSLESTLYPSTPASPSSSIASIDLAPAVQKSFSSFYSFLFPFLKPDGSKSLPPQLAIPVLSVALAPKYKLGKEFVEYAENLGEGFKSVSGDVWGMLLEFIETVGEDLKGWNEMDAWPSTIDNFVQWKKDKDEKEKMNTTSTA